MAAPQNIIGSLLFAAVSLSAAGPPSTSYTGNFAVDDDRREFFFTLALPGAVVIRTFSYAGGVNGTGATVPRGGFDPTLSLFASNGITLAVNRDGGCALVAKDAVTSSCWDAFLSVNIPAGNYRVVLTQSDNAAAGPNITDSFLFDGQGNFTQPPGNAPAGFWDYYPNQRTGFYALDIQGASSSQAPAVTSSATAPNGIAGQPYPPFTLTAQGLPGATFTWSATGLPPGLSLSSAGVLQGTPTAKGAFTFIAKADDGVQPVQQTVTILIYDPLSITTTLLPQGTASQLYGPVTLTATGGSGTYAWSSPNLPTGLALSASGQISGIPQVAGAYNGIAITVVDTSSGQSVTGTFSLNIATAPPLSLSIVTSADLPGIAVGTPVNTIFTAVGGKPPYSWTATNLPPGVTINAATGALSGAPTVPGIYNFFVQVTDSQQVSAGLTATLSVLGIVTSSLPTGTVAGPYSTSIVAVGGTPPYIFTGTGIPAGLSLSTAGLLSGTALNAGSYSLTVTVKDAAGISASVNFTLAITAPGPLTVTGGSLPEGAVGILYSGSLTASGGKPPYAWSLASGTLPDGLSLSSSGTVTGSPTKAGTFAFTAQATDAAGASISGNFTIAIAAAPLTLSSGNSLPNGVAGAEYPLQIFIVSGGTPPYNIAITNGSLPPGLVFSSGQIGGIPTVAGLFSFVLTVTDAAGKTSTQALSITINPAQADLIISQTYLSFSLTTGATGVPDPNSVTVRSSVVEQLLTYAIAVSPAVAWLDITAGGSTPGSIGVALNRSALALAATASPYTTTVTVTCTAPSPCAGRAQTIAVSLAVSAPPARLAISSDLLSFVSMTANPAPVTQTLGILNKGAGTLGITSIAAADTWVTVSGTPATVAAGPAVPIAVTVDPSGLAPGFHRSSVTVVSTAGTATAYVGILISNAAVMTLAPSAAQFQLPAGGALGKANGSFAVSTAAANWSAEVVGASWLTVNSVTAATVNFSIDPVAAAGFPAGTYYGTIRVTSTGVVNSPLDFQVMLIVTPAEEPVKPNPSPGGLVFISSATATMQTVQVLASSVKPLPYQASVNSEAAGWLSVAPATGTTSADAPAQSIVTANPAGLKPGLYRGAVNYAFSSAAVRTVDITLLVLSATSCSPTQTITTYIGLPNNFAQLATLATPLSVFVLDDCGSPVTTAQVSIAFSNGDAPLNLTALSSQPGVYFGTWTPVGVSPQVTVTARAVTPGLAPGTAQITGEVTAKSGPALTPNGTVHIYNPAVGGPEAPGGIVQIYGSNLSSQTVASSTVPLTAALGGTSVSIGGISAPLYYVSPNQINAQVPFELVPDRQYQIVVNSAGALSSPINIVVSAAVPGIAAFANGYIIAQHADLTLVSQALPAQPGETIVFYAAGLGATDNPVKTGSASPADPLARPLSAASLTLNGVDAPIQFVGLTPGSIGLYQINLTVPLNTPDGNLQLVLTQAGSKSNAVTLPVKR